MTDDGTSTIFVASIRLAGDTAPFSAALPGLVT